MKMKMKMKIKESEGLRWNLNDVSRAKVRTNHATWNLGMRRRHPTTLNASKLSIHLCQNLPEFAVMGRFHWYLKTFMNIKTWFGHHPDHAPYGNTFRYAFLHWPTASLKTGNSNLVNDKAHCMTTITTRKDATTVISSRGFKPTYLNTPEMQRFVYASSPIVRLTI